MTAARRLGMAASAADLETPACPPGEAVVALPYGVNGSALGLDRPVALRGGDASSLRRLRQLLRCFSDARLSALVAEAVDRAASDAMEGFVMRPALLTGECGAGRTHVARRLAHAAGVPHVLWDLRPASKWRTLRPQPRGPDLALPILPVLAIAAARCANVVISVVGADAVGEVKQLELAWMIDPRNAARCSEDAIEAFVDLRHVSWIVQHDGGALSPSLMKLLSPAHLECATGVAAEMHAAEVLAEACLDENVGELPGEMLVALLTRLKTTGRTKRTSELYDQACSLVRIET